MRFVPALAMLSLVLALAACGTTANKDSVEYQAGYSDGCATGGARASRTDQAVVRQDEVYANNADYRAGWSAGYHVCGAGADAGHL